MDTLLFSLLNGVLYGMLLFMLASGLTLILSMMGILNFAHAGFYMLGAYFAYEISRVAGFWVALVVAPLLVGLCGALLERYGLRSVHKHGHIAELLFTFGVGILIDELVILVWGRLPVDYRIPPELDFAAFNLFGIDYPAYRIFMLAVGIFAFLALYLAISRTRVGLIVQAALQHPDMVQALGHDVPKVFMLVFAAGTALAGLAGVISGNFFVTDPGMALSMGSLIFVVIVLGGLGSLGGALIASILVGIIQTLFATIDFSVADALAWMGMATPDIQALQELWALSFSRLSGLIPYILLCVVILIRPRGLMGSRDH
jgi:branched-chain amino acid transport system permease protein